MNFVSSGFTKDNKKPKTKATLFTVVTANVLFQQKKPTGNIKFFPNSSKL